MSKPQRRGDDASVIPFEVAGAAAVVIGATILTGALFDASQAAARLMVVAVAVGGCAALVRRTWAVRPAGRCRRAGAGVR